MSISTALDRLADTQRLDAGIAPIRALVNRLLRPQALKDMLHGVWLGHPLHPAMAQVPIGAWLSAGLLDALPGHRKEAQLLVATGIAAAVPTALAGAADWSESDVGQQRVGAVHAVMNSAALALYVGSLVARMRGNQRTGRRLAYAGLGLASASAGIGGHLAYHQASGASHATTAARAVSQKWIDLGPLADLPDGQPVLRVSQDSDDRPTPLCVLRHGQQAQVLVDVCSHLGGPLHSGELVEVGGKECLVCPWHGSTFAVSDGSVARGPAVAPATVLHTRVSAGRLEARLPERHIN
ncbi:MAG: Rieske 2Fe-2S domain-containing protein [Geodermatophilaceae bacterium]|nr:Rieske 2Fe-2S domain-containing protein [Geodermatophilaceae bacterium]MDQ3475912.1 Rieske (2Fe-2S) protein [Actinomycetota bacterium]